MALNLKRLFGKSDTDEYVEIDLNAMESKDVNVVVKPFVLKVYDDITDVLNSIREGYTIAVIDIKPLKTKDVVELKRAISKIKKTVEAISALIIWRLCVARSPLLIANQPKMRKTPANPFKLAFIIGKHACGLKTSP